MASLGLSQGPCSLPCMSESGSPMGFPSPNPDRERDGWRLLFVVLAIVVAGAAAFAFINLGMA